MLGIMSETCCWRLQLLCIIAIFLPLETQEYNHNGKQNRNEMEVLNRYNEMHTKDYGKFGISSCQAYDVSLFKCIVLLYFYYEGSLAKTQFPIFKTILFHTHRRHLSQRIKFVYLVSQSFQERENPFHIEEDQISFLDNWKNWNHFQNCLHKLHSCFHL